MKFYTTQAISAIMAENPIFKNFIFESVRRHLSGDWGEISEEDATINNENPLYSLSDYLFENNIKIWIKQDDEILTVLFPDEY